MEIYKNFIDEIDNLAVIWKIDNSEDNSFSISQYYSNSIDDIKPLDTLYYENIYSKSLNKNDTHELNKIKSDRGYAFIVKKKYICEIIDKNFDNFCMIIWVNYWNGKLLDYKNINSDKKYFERKISNEEDRKKNKSLKKKTSRDSDTENNCEIVKSNDYFKRFSGYTTDNLKVGDIFKYNFKIKPEKIYNNILETKDNLFINVDYYCVFRNKYIQIFLRDLTHINKNISYYKCLNYIEQPIAIFDLDHENKTDLSNLSYSDSSNNLNNNNNDIKFSKYECIDSNLAFIKLFPHCLQKKIIDIFDESFYFKLRKNIQVILSSGDFTFNSKIGEYKYKINCFYIEDKSFGIEFNKTDINKQITDNILVGIKDHIVKPLNSNATIINYLANTKLDADQKTYIGSLTKNNYNLISTVNDIIDYNKIKSKSYKIVNEPIIFKKEIEDIIRIFDYRSNESINISINDNVPYYLLADISLLGKLMVNFIGYLKKNYSNTEFELSIDLLEMNNKKISLKFTTELKSHDVKINKSSVLGKSSSFNSYNYGSNLEMGIVREIIKLLNGKIWLDENQILFNISFDEIIDSKLFNNKLNLLMKNKKVIICESDKNDRTLIKKLLNKHNIITISYSSFDEAFMNIDIANLLIISESDMNSGNEIKIIKRGIPTILLGKSNSHFEYIIEKPISKINLIVEILRIMNDENKNNEVFEPLMHKICIYDNSNTNQLLLIRILNKLGYKNVNVIKDADDLTQYEICFIDGVYYHNIKNIEKNKEYFIGMFSKGDKKLKKKYKNYGFDVYLQKPVNEKQIDILLKVILKNIKRNSLIE